MVRDGYPQKKTFVDEVAARTWYSGYGFITHADIDYLSILKGKNLEYSNYYADVDVASGVKVLFFTTGSEPMISYDIVADDAVRLLTYEDVVPTATGVQVTKINTNRTSSFQGRTIAFSGSSVYDVGASGTLLRTAYIAANKFAGGSAKSPSMFRTKRNAYYLYHVVPDADNTVVGLTFRWQATKV